LTNFTVRPRTQADQTQLEEIVDKSFNNYLNYYARHSLTSKGHMLVCQTDAGQIAGYVKLTWFSIKNQKYGCILFVAVHPNFRRMGLASSLIEAGIEYLKSNGAQLVFASIDHNNKASLATFGHKEFKRMAFSDVWQLFGWRTLKFYLKIVYIIGEAVVMHS
jgi:[ribosomal protein S18]-alanine N-acetyltransferase